LLDHAITKGGSVRPSVFLSITLMSHAWMVSRYHSTFAPYDRAVFL